MFKLLKYLKEYRIRAILAPIFKMLEASFELMVPLVMQRLIDVGISAQDKSAVYRMGALLILLTVVGYAASITAQYFAAKSASGFGRALRKDLFYHISHLSYKEIDRLGSSSLITRMTSDLNQTVTGVNMFLRLFLRSPFIVFGALIMAFTVDVPTATVFAYVLPVLIVIVFVITFATIPMYKKVQDKLDKVTLLTRESLIGIRVIRAFNRQEIEEEEYQRANTELMKSQLLVGRVSVLMNPVTYLVVNLGIAALIYTGALRVESGLMTQGQIVALVNYMSQILVELVKLASLIITLTKAIASARRISDIMNVKSSLEFGDVDIREAINDSKVNAPFTLEFKDVSMKYEGGRKNAISDVTFSAKMGDTIGIIGGTGSGKSTLVNLIPRLYEATEGDISINGISIKDISKESLRGIVGVVPQEAVLFRGTIEDNLRMSDENASGNLINAALDISQSREFVDSKEGGIKSEVLQNGKNLSGGQRQRLSIARALVKNPKILILDDSSSALDFSTERKLKTALSRGKKDRITIIVSQRPSTIMDADQILVLDDGQVVAQGRHASLIRTSEIYREIYHTQFKEKEGA
ncbi:MAG: ABC transporter ATP-binding protein/permease [Eubacterium sp.]|nr:ABC transporter ATP-binding protein/permease [Eubacterium sp.]